MTLWSEADSGACADLGDVFVPGRHEQREALLRLVPAAPDEAFCAVDLGCGDGTLAAALLTRFLRASLVAVDASESRRELARQRLAAFRGRAQVRLARLEEAAWLKVVPNSVRCVLSALALHHLEEADKRWVFSAVRDRLEPGGAFLVADLVEPSVAAARALFADTWDAEVRTAGPAVFERFQAEGWNRHRTPDAAVDKPSPLFAQLVWLREAGFRDVDCFWMRAGHAVFGGFR